MEERIDVSKLTVSTEILKLIPAEIAHLRRVLPLRIEDEQLVVAVENAINTQALDYLRFIVNREIIPIAAPLIDLKFAIWRHYGPEPENVEFGNFSA